jgi:hypothetical protein
MFWRIYTLIAGLLDAMKTKARWMHDLRVDDSFRGRIHIGPRNGRHDPKGSTANKEEVLA